jgi:hypothetical protein
MQQNKLIQHKKLLYIGLPLAVVIPLLIVSWLIGPTSIWIWAGVALGMVIITWQLKRKKENNFQVDNLEDLLDLGKMQVRDIRDLTQDRDEPQ